MVVVRFLRSYSVYNAGEEAGFEEARAAELIGANVVVAVDAPPAEQREAEAKATEQQQQEQRAGARGEAELRAVTKAPEDRQARPGSR